MEIEWVDGFTIKVSVDQTKTVLISANKEGLLSLAMQLRAMANEVSGAIVIMMSIIHLKKAHLS